jgi:hypothetical protein
MHDNSKHVDTYKDYKLLDNKWKLVKNLKGTWRQKLGYGFELYGHEIFLLTGIKYNGNPIDPEEWLKDDSTKSKEERHVDFETGDAEFEFKWNNYYLKPCHFYRDILPRFRDKNKRWVLVVLDKRKCRDIRELLEYYSITLWDLEDMRRYYQGLGTMGMGRGRVLPCRRLVSDISISSNVYSSKYSTLCKGLKLMKIRLRDLFSMCRIPNCRVYMLNRRPMNKDTYLSGILRNIFQSRNFMRILT